MPSIEHLENQHIEILQSQDDTTCGVENDGPCIGNSLTESIVITKGNSSERTVVKQEEKSEENNEERENTHEDIQEKQLAEDCCGMTCEAEQKPQGRSDSSDNNYSDIAVNITIPCCRKRKCPKTKKCATGYTCTYLDSCCYSDAPAAVIDNVKLKQENKALKNCIKRVRACAVNDACELIKSIMGGCKCSCCMARTKLRPCKSVTSTLGRETWLCVPTTSRGRCGGYTPSGWGKLLKKCKEVTTDVCEPCDMTLRSTPCVSLRCKCLTRPCPCPPCPHLCPVRSLPPSLRPFTPCCPMYFPTTVCNPCVPAATSTAIAPVAAPYKTCGSAETCKTSAITVPPYKPKYMSMSDFCNRVPHSSASAPGSLPKIDAILKEDTSYSPIGN